MKKKFISFALLFCLIIPCFFTLAACGNKGGKSNAKFTIDEDVLENTETIIEDLKTNYYNAASLGKEKTYSVDDIKETNENFNYYVEIGTTDGIDKVDSLTIGSNTLKKNDSFKLSIGNANYIEDKCFYADDEKIFVAAPIIAFETVNNSKIKINDNSFDFDLDVSATKKNFTNAEFEAGSTNAVTKHDDYLDLELKDAKTYLKLTYDNASSNDVILTKKVLSGSGKTELNTISYALTKVEPVEGSPLAVYPIGYSQNALTEEWQTWYDGTTINFEAYVSNGTIYRATFKLDIVLSSAE